MTEPPPPDTARPADRDASSGASSPGAREDRRAWPDLNLIVAGAILLPLPRRRLHPPVPGAAPRLPPRAGGPPALRADPAATASRQRRRRLPVRRDALRAFLRHVSSRGKLPRGHPGDRREDPHGADGEKPHGKSRGTEPPGRRGGPGDRGAGGARAPPR